MRATALPTWMVLLAALSPSLHGQEEPGHNFQPIKPDWTVREEWLKLPQEVPISPKSEGGMIKLRRDGLIYIRPENRAQAERDCWREIRYLDGKRTPKTLLYDPEKRLRMEVDDLGDEQFLRLLHPNGRTAVYVHSRNTHWLDGFSVSADGRTTHKVIAGSGELVEPGYQVGECIHRWVRGELVYLEKAFSGGTCVSISLAVQGAHLNIRPNEEHLMLPSECESWSRENGKAPTVTIDEWYINGEDGTLHRQKVPPKTDIRPMPLSWHGPESAAQAIRDEWARAYPKRRSAFIARYADELKAAGETWSVLGIAFVRDETPWFPAGTTSFPRLGGRKIAPFRCKVDLESGVAEVDCPKNLEKDEEAAWDSLTAHLSRGGRTFKILIEDNKDGKVQKQAPGIPGFPDRARVSIVELDDQTKRIVRSTPVQEFLGEHEKHGIRALILKDGQLKFWIQFWVND